MKCRIFRYELGAEWGRSPKAYLKKIVLYKALDGSWRLFFFDTLGLYKQYPVINGKGEVTPAQSRNDLETVAWVFRRDWKVMC